MKHTRAPSRYDFDMLEAEKMFPQKLIMETKFARTMQPLFSLSRFVALLSKSLFGPGMGMGMGLKPDSRTSSLSYAQLSAREKTAEKRSSRATSLLLMVLLLGAW